MQLRQSLLTVTGFCGLFGIALLSARSLLRVWVQAQRNQWVIPFNGELLMAAGLFFLGAAVLMIAVALQKEAVRKVEAGCETPAILLMAGATIGLVASGSAQAWLHVARFAIPGGALHPRSLVGASAALILIALGLLYYAWRPSTSSSRY